MRKLNSINVPFYKHVVERGMGGAWQAFSAPFSFNFVTTVLLGSWGQLGVLLFVIVSSWFMVDRQGICSKKFVDLVFQTWSTCVLIVIVFLIINPKLVNIKVVARELLTPANKQYWFITTFLVFYLIVPLLQKSVQGLSDKDLGNVCIVLTAIIPMYNLFSPNVGDSLADFGYVFYLVGYLKRKKNNIFERKCKFGFVGLAFMGAFLLS